MRRYYNPALTSDEVDALDWENFVVVHAVQATLGNISTGIRAIFVEAPRGSAKFHFVIAEGRDQKCAEDIEEVVTEFDALLSGTPGYESVDSEVRVEEVPSDWAERRWRGIYWSRGWTALRSDETNT